MIGKVGADSNGEIMLKALKKDGINIEHVGIDNETTTGVAIISVDDEGNNTIQVISGANMNIKKEEIQKFSEIIKKSYLIVAQFETPIELTIEAFKIAKENNVITVLNPAPAAAIPGELLGLTDIIASNETEAFEITGIKVESVDDMKKASNKLIEKGVRFVIITLGSRGASVASKDNFEIVPAYSVNPVDTTSAGDGFIGAVCYKLQNKKYLDFEIIKNAVRFGNKVSSIVVQKKGAQPSLPYLKEVNSVYGDE
jgi:ribokinase